MKKFISLILFFLLALSGTAFAGGTIQWPTACFFDSNGDPLSGGLLNSYVAGTSTRKALYSDREATTAHTNPEVLDANGCTEVYGVGTYKLVLTDAAASTTYFTDDNVTVSERSISYFYPEYNAANQGATGDNNTIKYAVDTCSTNKCTIVLQHNSEGADTTYTLSTTEVVPSNITLKFENGATIADDASNADLTINGPLEAGPYQIFDWGNGTGTLTLGNKISITFPNWFATNSTPGTTDMKAAIQLAANNHKIVNFLAETYFVSGEITLQRGNILQGAGLDNTIIEASHAGNIFKNVYSEGDGLSTRWYYSETRGFWLKDLTIDGLDVANGGVGLLTSFSDDDRAGVEVTRASGIESCQFYNLAKGVEFEQVQGFAIRDSVFRYNTNAIYHHSTIANGTAHMISIRDCDFRYNTVGVHIDYTSASKPYSWSFDTCHFELNGIGLDLYAAPRWYFINCKWEQNTKEAIIADTCELHVFIGCYFNNNSTVDNDEQIFYGRLTPFNAYGLSETVFINCSWTAGSSTYDLKLVEARKVKLINCEIDASRISKDYYSDYDFDGWTGSNSVLPDPIQTFQKVVLGWIEHTDLAAAVEFGNFSHNNSGTIKSQVYLDQIKISVTEAFSTGDGTYVKIGVGKTGSSQLYSVAHDVTSTGTKTPTMNNEGFINVGDPDILVTLFSDGTLDANGKALVMIPYYDSPASP